MAMTTKEFAGRYRRFTETGTDNNELAAVTPTINAPSNKPFKVLYATCKYTAVPVQAGVKTEVTSGAGAPYNTELEKATANAQSTVYFPDGELVLADGDALTMTAPAGGAGKIASIAIYGGYTG